MNPNQNATSFQVLSRNNDVNGNPYRLIIVYNDKGSIIEIYEARSSMPNQVRVLEQRGLVQLFTFHLTPSKYNDLKKIYKDILKNAY